MLTFHQRVNFLHNQGYFEIFIHLYWITFHQFHKAYDNCPNPATCVKYDKCTSTVLQENVEPYILLGTLLFFIYIQKWGMNMYYWFSYFNCFIKSTINGFPPKKTTSTTLSFSLYWKHRKRKKRCCKSTAMSLKCITCISSFLQESPCRIMAVLPMRIQIYIRLLLPPSDIEQILALSRSAFCPF